MTRTAPGVSKTSGDFSGGDFGRVKSFPRSGAAGATEIRAGVSAGFPQVSNPRSQSSPVVSGNSPRMKKLFSSPIVKTVGVVLGTIIVLKFVAPMLPLPANVKKFVPFSGV